MRDGEDLIAFPAFLQRTHDLYIFSDAAMHMSCFEQHPECREVERLYKKFQAIWVSRPRDLESPEQIEAWGKKTFEEFR